MAFANRAWQNHTWRGIYNANEAGGGDWSIDCAWEVRVMCRRLGIIAVVAGLSFSAMSADRLPRVSPNSVESDKPHINPSPHRALVLRGHKPPELEIVFSVIYSTTNPECEARSIPAVIFGAPRTPQSVTDAVQIARGEAGFAVTIYLDQYLPGRCNWEPISILHMVTDRAVTGRMPHRGLVAIRKDGSREVFRSFVCAASPTPQGPQTTTNDCVLNSNRSDDLASASGGVVNLRYSSP